MELTTLRRNWQIAQNELKPGASAPGAGASLDSLPRVSSATVASNAPGLHPVDAPTLSNRPLYQSCGAEPPKDVNFDTKLTFLFLRVLILESCKLALSIPRSALIFAIIALASSKSPFFSLRLHLTKVRIFASLGIKILFCPAKMHPLGTITILVND